MTMRMFRRSTTKAATLIGICLLSGTLQADIAIKPAFVEVSMDEGRPAGTFLISNVGDKEERFRINAIHFTYTEEGALKRSQTGEYTLAPWIRFNPRELTLAPGTQRAVRFAVVSRGKLVEGEYWAAMELESLTVNDMVAKEDKAGRSMKLRAVTTILVGIFGTVGKIAYEGQIKDLQVQVENGAVVLRTLVAATGTGRLGVKGGTYEIVDASGKVIDNGPYAAGYVMRGTQRWLTTKLGANIPKGAYTVKVSLQAPHLDQPLAKEIQVTWPELPPVQTQAAIDPTAPPATEKQQSQPRSPTDGDKQKEVQGSAGNK
jgi:hypothetical protein